MDLKLFEIGWLMTKYVTIPIIVLGITIFFIYFIILVIKETKKNLKK